MATYRFAAQVIGRSRGYSAVAAAAYRSGTALFDRRTEELHDYRKRGGVAFRTILAPDGTAPRLTVRSELWNAVEAREARRDAQLAREVQFSLPHELDEDARRELLVGFVREQFVARGMIADVAIHRPDRGGDQRNHHSHVMLTLRSVSGARFGEKVRSWNDRTLLEGWRVAWEHAANRALERAGVGARVDHRTLAAQGIDREPEPKQGAIATTMERRGHESHAGRDRAEVKARNAERERQRGRDAERARRGEREGAQRSEREHVAASGSPLLQGVTTDVAQGPPAPGWSEPARVSLQRLVSLLRLEDEQMPNKSAPQTRKVDGKLQRAGWHVRVVAGGTREYRRGTALIEDRGDQIVVHGESKEQVTALLELAKEHGWKTLTFGGSDAYKLMGWTMALEAGFEVDVAAQRDAALLTELKGARAATFDERSVRARVEGEMRPPTPDDALLARAEGDAAKARDLRAEETRVRSGYVDAVVDRERAQARAAVREAVQGTAMADVVVEEALKFCTQQNATFDRGDVERFCKTYARDDAHLSELVVSVLASPELMKIGVDRGGRERYTTQKQRSETEQMMRWADELKKGVGYGVDAATVEKIAERRTFSPEQSDALKHLTADDRFGLLIGQAGTGKTYLLGGAVEAWKSAGYEVFGGALASVAVDGLIEAGIENATTLASLERRPPDAMPGQKWVLVIDEAGMIGTRMTSQVEKWASDRGGKVVLVGSYMQLQPIEAGGAFRVLVERLGAAKLSGIRRQELDVADAHPEWMREATRAFEDGRTGEGLRAYRDRGHVHESKTTEDAKAAIVTELFAQWDLTPDMEQLVLAYRRNDVADLNERIRAERVARGEIGESKVYKLADGERALGVGDRVVFGKPKRGFPTIGGGQVDIRNGSRGVVTAVLDENRFDVALESGKAVRVDVSEYENVDRAYCLTGHKSQGKTIKNGRAYVLASSLFDQHMVCVTMSRHQKMADMYYGQDQFRSYRQLERVCARSGLKDVTVDYSLDGAESFFGRGIPMQGPDGIALRSPARLRGDLRELLALGEDLGRSAADGERAAAQAGLVAVRAWYKELDEKLGELETRGVDRIAIRGGGGELRERVAAVEAGIAEAVNRARVQDRGVERAVGGVAVKELRSAVVRWRTALEGDVAANIAERESVPKQPLLPNPDVEIQRLVETRRVELRGAGTPTAQEVLKIATLERAIADRRDAPAARAELEDLRAGIELRAASAREAVADAERAAVDEGARAQRIAAFEVRREEHAAAQSRLAALALAANGFAGELDVLARVDARLAELDEAGVGRVDAVIEAERVQGAALEALASELDAVKLPEREEGRAIA